MAQTAASYLQQTRLWLDSSRWVSLPNSAMPCILGGLTAFADHRFDVLRFVVAFLGIMAIHLGTNLLDDYADLKIGGFTLRDSVKAQKGEGIRTAKAPYIVDGSITMRQVLYAAWGLFGFGIASGAYLAFVSGWLIIAIAIFGGVICFFYSMPPIKLGYRGMGEAVVALAMGPGICFGTYFAVAQRFSWTPVLVGIIMGCLIGTILFVHSIMDFVPDRAVNKKTCISYLGGPRTATKLLPAIFIIVYGTTLAGILTGALPLTFALLFLSLPLAIKLVRLMNKLKKHDYGPEKIHWWMGPMELKIKEHEWFLVRWLLARNLMIYSTLLILAALVIDLI